MSRTSTFVVGAIVGAAAALLCAPRPGKEVRAFLADKLGQAQAVPAVGEQPVEAAEAVEAEALESAAPAGAVFGFDYTKLAAKGQEIANMAVAKGQELYGKVSACVQEAADAAKPKINAATSSDELRDKIEAARARIAAQVAANAASAPVEAEVVEVAAEPVQEPAEAEQQ